MSIDLNQRINMSTYLNKESCMRFLGQTLASAVKKLNELVDIENDEKNGTNMIIAGIINKYLTMDIVG